MTASKLDPEACRRLAAECREDDRRMEDAPWTIVEHDRVQRFVITAREGKNEISRDLADEDAMGIARTRNNLPAIAAQLTAAAEMAERQARHMPGYEPCRDCRYWLGVVTQACDAHRTKPALTADEVRVVVREAASDHLGPDSEGWGKVADDIASVAAAKLAGLALADGASLARVVELEAAVERMAPVVRACEGWVDNGPVCAGLVQAVQTYREKLAGHPIVAVPQPGAIAPADAAIIDDALDYYDRIGIGSPHAEIARIRAALTGKAPS